MHSLKHTPSEIFMRRWEERLSMQPKPSKDELSGWLAQTSPHHPNENMRWLYDRLLMEIAFMTPDEQIAALQTKLQIAEVALDYIAYIEKPEEIPPEAASWYTTSSLQSDRAEETLTQIRSDHIREATKMVGEEK